MTWLAIIPEGQPHLRSSASADAAVIARSLQPWGIRFERWHPARTESDDPLERYAPQVTALREQGFGTIDVVHVTPDAADPEWSERARAMREKFRDEHTHAEDEVRFFAAGAGVFYLRLGASVYALRCEAGDLLSVPAGTRHWFDMGAEPRFTAIRFFASAEGWIGSFSGDPIARALPSFEELAAEALGAAAGTREGAK